MSSSRTNVRSRGGSHRSHAAWRTMDGAAKRPLAVALTIGMLLFGSGGVAYASAEAQTTEQSAGQEAPAESQVVDDSTAPAVDDAAPEAAPAEEDKAAEPQEPAADTANKKAEDSGSSKKEPEAKKSNESSSDEGASSSPTKKSAGTPSNETTNIRIYKTVDGQAIKQGFSFEATSVVGAEMSAPLTHKTDGQGRAGVYTIKAVAGAESKVTFQETALDDTQSYELTSAQCYWGKTVEPNAQQLTTKILSSSKFSVDIPVLDDKNKQDVACSLDNSTIKSEEPAVEETTSAPDPKDDQTTDSTDEPTGEASTPAEPAVDGFVASKALQSRALAQAAAASANPSINAVCGLNVVLTFDISGSVRDQLQTMKDAGNVFVDALAGMRGKIAVTSFATQAYSNLVFTPVSSANTIKSAINALAIPSGNNAQYTNWQAGLTTAQSTANSSTGNTLGTVVIFITDGDPNRIGTGTSANTDAAVAAAVPVANSIKDSGKRVFGLSVGTSADQHGRVQQISGSTPLSGNTFLTSDYTTIANYAALEAELKKVAKDLCGGTVTIEKKLEKVDGTVVPQEGIEFGATTVAPGSIPNQPALTDATGGTAVKVELATGSSSAPVTITEKSTSADYSLDKVVCDGSTMSLTSNSWNVTVKDNTAVSCVVTNKEVQKYGDLTLTKNVQVRPNDNTVASSFKLIAKDSKGGASIAEVPTTNVSSDGLTASTAKTQVKAGDYALSETMKDGSAVSATEYLTSDWTCTSDGKAIAVTGGVVKVGVGADVQCQVTNTARNAEQTTNLTIQKLINGQPAAQGFIFTGSAVNQQDVNIPVNPDSHSTDGQGRAGEFTFKTAKNEAIVATFVESFVQQGNNAITDPYVIDSARCWYSDAGFKEKITELTDVVVSDDGTSFTVTIPQMDSKNKQEILCDVNNVTPTGKLTLVKNVINDNGGSLLAKDFTLKAAGSVVIEANATENTQNNGLTGSVTKTVPVGKYTLSELVNDGYVPTGWTCAGSDAVVTEVTVTYKSNVICSITNDDKAGELVLVKTVKNDNGGTAKASDFTLTASGPSSFSGLADQNLSGDKLVGQVSKSVDAGQYTLSEGGPAGYAKGSWTCVGGAFKDGKVTVANGADVTCSITNNDKAGELVLVKTVKNDNGGTAKASDFTLTASGPTSFSGPADQNLSGDKLVGQVSKSVDAGQYTLSEDGPAGYAKGSWTCVGGEFKDGKVTVANGADVTCSITNDDEQGKLILEKVVVNNNGGSAKASDFTLTADGPTDLSGPADQNLSDDGSTGEVSGLVDAGTYTLSEDGPAGYAASDWVCAPVSDNQDKSASTPSDEVTVGNGQTIKCTITNNDKAGELVLVKTVKNDNGGTAKASDFTLTADGPTDLSGPADQNLSDDGSTGEVSGLVDAGKYTLSEDGPAGYSASDWVCAPVSDNQDKSASTPSDEVTVGNGQTIKCTITNDDEQGKLILEKVVVNNNGGSAKASDFTLTADGPTDLSGPADQNLSDDGSTGEVSGLVDAGTYTLSEDGPAGYSASDWVCAPVSDRQDKSASTPSDEVTVGNGQTIKCTITNDDIASVIEVDKEIGENGITRIGNDTFRAEYTVKVTSDGVHPNSYTLEDQPSLPAGAELLSVTAAKTADVPDSIELVAGFNGVDQPVIVADAPIAGGATHTYTVVVEFKIPLAVADEVVRTCEVETPGMGGAYNEATISVDGQDPKSDDACIDIPERPVVNLGITKEALSPEPGSMVEAGEDVTYAITVTNNLDETAYAVRITDDLPDELQFKEITDLPAGWTHTEDPDGTHVVSNPDGIAGGESITFNLVATYVPTETSEPTEIVNTACVESVGYENEAAGEDGKACDTETVKVASLVAEVGPICEAGIPALDFKLTGTNFEFTPGQEITVTWKSADGLTVLHEQTVTAEEAGAIANGSLVWPGVTLDSDGAPTAWPGYRAVVAGETPDFLNFIKDDSVDSAKFLAPMQIEFSVNPTAGASVELGVLSPDCFAGFTGSPEIEKTASVENIQPNKDFTYTLSTSNAGNGVLNNAVLVDEIPDNIAVKNISVDSTVFPTWENCEVTGAVGGKGGTLKCELNGPAAANSELPDVVLTVAAQGDFSGDESTTIVNTAQLCATVNSTDEEPTCVEDEVPVKVIGSGEEPQIITPEPSEEPSEEPTPDSSEEPDELEQTGFNIAPALWAAGLLVAGVTLAAGVNRRRENREKSSRAAGCW